MKKGFKALLLLLFMVMAIPHLLKACDCIMYPAVHNAKTSEYVLVVTAGKIYETSESYLSGMKADVEVHEVLKGEITAGKTILFDSKDSSDCSFKFETGKKYLLFAYRSGEWFFVYNCYQSAEWSASIMNYKKVKRFLRKSRKAD